MKNYQTLVTHLPEGILKITLNRPEKLNSINETLFEEFSDVLDFAANSDDVKALLITGEGKAFCAGVDIHRLVNLDAQSGFEFAKKGQAVFQKLEDLNKPSLVAVNGMAFGGGCELAIAATLRIASENASFAQPEVKLGLIPGYGGTQRLSRLIGKGRALDLCVTGRTVSAQEALSYGLINEIVPQNKLLKHAEKILKNILALAPLAVKSTIEVINCGSDLPLKEAIDLEAAHFGMLCATEDKREGVEAFLNKRAPEFSEK